LIIANTTISVSDIMSRRVGPIATYEVVIVEQIVRIDDVIINDSVVLSPAVIASGILHFKNTYVTLIKHQDHRLTKKSFGLLLTYFGSLIKF
jgi:hypothetical protein